MDAFADWHFLARSDQGFPNIGFELSGEKYLDVSGEVFAGCFAGGLLRVNAEAPAEEASGNNAGVVEDDQFVSGEEIGEVFELRVFQATGRSQEDEQSGCVATVEGALGD
jgi:hypothetical protein